MEHTKVNHAHHLYSHHKQPASPISIQDVAKIARDVNEVVRFSDLKTTGSDTLTGPRIVAGIYASLLGGGIGGILESAAVMGTGLAGVVALPALGVVLYSTDIENIKEAIAGIEHFKKKREQATPLQRELIDRLVIKALDARPRPPADTVGGEHVAALRKLCGSDAALGPPPEALSGAVETGEAYLAHMAGDVKGFKKRMNSIQDTFGLTEEQGRELREATPRKLTYGLKDVARQMIGRDRFEVT